MSVSEAKYAALLQRIEELENDNRFRSHVAALRQEIEDMNKDYFTEVSLGKTVLNFGNNLYIAWWNRSKSSAVRSRYF